MLHRSALLILSLSVGGCATFPAVPESPRVMQYGIQADIGPGGFFGFDSETGERMFRPFRDPKMKAGQCLSASDYEKEQAWVSELRELAEKRCR